MRHKEVPMRVQIVIHRAERAENERPKASRSRSKFWKRGVVASALAVSLVAVAGGVALATIPDANGVFHGCVNNSTGALRVINTGTGGACTAAEMAISWDQSGIHWRDTWSATTAYAQYDAVAYLGSSYIAKKASTDAVPTTSSAWALLAKEGAAGAPGESGRDGTTILNGTTNPGAGIGTTGDFYINTTRNVLFGPAVRTCTRLVCGTDWGQGVALVGPPGPSGGTANFSNTVGDVNLISGGTTTLLTQTVPVRGDYTVTASLDLENGSGQPLWLCNLYAANPSGSAVLLNTEEAWGPEGGNSDSVTPMTLLGVVSIEAGGTIWVSCTEYAQHKDDDAYVSIISQQVSDFTGSYQN
jgi:hypothetical protein